MEAAIPTTGELLQLASGRTAPLSGRAWRTSLYGAFEREHLIVEAELSRDVGLVAVFGVPSTDVTEALLILSAMRLPGRASAAGATRCIATVLVEGERLAAGERAWARAREARDPAERWLGRDGCWAVTEVWNGGRRESIFGTMFPAGEVAEIDATTRALLACVPLDGMEPEFLGLFQKWQGWCTPRPPPTRNQLKHRRR